MYTIHVTDHDGVVRPIHFSEISDREPKPDPWIKVGTTTIDGTLDQMLTVLEETDMERSAEDAIDAFMRDDGPWFIGGRYLKARGSHVNLSAGTALIRCDIVRRQSEIDEEEMIDAEVAYQAQRAAMPETRLTCPECGPHGNRGEVMLAASWAKCTTCAGGKPGDLWGGVEECQERPVDASDGAYATTWQAYGDHIVYTYKPLFIDIPRVLITI